MLAFLSYPNREQLLTTLQGNQPHLSLLPVARLEHKSHFENIVSATHYSLIKHNLGSNSNLVFWAVITVQYHRYGRGS
jgi:hypothetical protein